MQSKNRTHLAMLVGLFTVVLCLLILLTLPRASHAQSPIQLGVSERISVGTGGVQTNRGSYHAFASADARYIGFISLATNIVEEVVTADTRCLPSLLCIDVFLHDRVANTTIRLSDGMDGLQANNSSFEPQLSSDGQTVHFTSHADDLVPGDTNFANGYYGVDGFVWHRGTQQITRETLRSDGEQISTNSYSYMPGAGTHIYFQTDAPSVVPGVVADEIEVYRRDLATGVVTHIPLAHNNNRMNGKLINLQADNAGRYVVFTSYSDNILSNDTNGVQDVFVHDTQSGVTRLVSRTPSGQFPNGDSGAPMVSPNGTHIVFRSAASNLVTGDTNGVSDVFMYAISSQQVTRVSVTESGGQANGRSKDPAVCNDGKFISFASGASNLIAGDTNDQYDVFLQHVESGAMVAVTRAANGTWGNDRGHKSRFIDDCSAILFASDASNLIPNDTNADRDLFYRTISISADLSTSYQSATPTASPNDVITYTVNLINSGGEATTINYSADLPTDTAFVSVSAPTTYVTGTQEFGYVGTLAANSSTTLTFSVQINAAVVTPTAIILNATVTSSEQTLPLVATTIVDGFDLYLPVITRP